MFSRGVKLFLFGILKTREGVRKKKTEKKRKEKRSKKEKNEPFFAKTRKKCYFWGLLRSIS